jgi:hypothetical protein
MAKDAKLNFEAVNLLTANSEAVDKAIKKAVNDALLKHKRAGNPIAVWRGKQVILLRPEEILPGKK